MSLGFMVGLLLMGNVGPTSLSLGFIKSLLLMWHVGPNPWFLGMLRGFICCINTNCINISLLSVRIGPTDYLIPIIYREGTPTLPRVVTATTSAASPPCSPAFIFPPSDDPTFPRVFCTKFDVENARGSGIVAWREDERQRIEGEMPSKWSP